MSPTLPQRPLRVQSDARLLQLARRGETPAFEALVRRYRKQLLGYCRRLGMGDAQAEDVLQQGLLHAWRALCRGDDVHDIKSWLYRVVHNAVLDVLRRPGRDTVQLDERLHGHVAPSAAGELDRRLTVHATLTELAALPDMQREALVRTAVHGDSHEQVASALGLSHAAVRGLVHRARVAMRTAAGALVPERAIQWLIRSGLGTGVGVPELGASNAGGGGMLTALAKGTAVLATGGMLVTGLVVDRHNHTHHARPRATGVAHATARPDAARGGALVASVGAPKAADPVALGAPRARRMTTSWEPARRGSHRDRHIRVTAAAPTPAADSAPERPAPAGSVAPRRGARRGRGESHTSSGVLVGPELHAEGGRLTPRSHDRQPQEGESSGEGGGGPADDQPGGETFTARHDDGRSGTGAQSGGRGGSSARVAERSRGGGYSDGGDGGDGSPPPAGEPGMQSDGAQGGGEPDGDRQGRDSGGDSGRDAHGETQVAGGRGAHTQEGSGD